MARNILILALLMVAAGPARAATYYVSGSGSNANPGTLAAPFQTIAHGMSAMHSGDTLYIRSGTYYESFWDGIPSGTSWSAVTTVAAYPGETVTIQPASGALRVFTFTNAHYIVLDRLIMDARNVQYEVVKITSSGGNVADHIRIQNSEVMNAPAAQGILIDATGVGNQFINDKVHDNGNNDFDHGLYIDSPNNLIDHCEIYRNSGWGVHIYNGYPNPGDNNNVISNNRIHDNARVGNRGAGIILSSGQGNMAYNNVIWNNSGGIQIDYGAVGSKVFNNTVYNNNGQENYGIYLGNGTSGNGTASSGAIVQNNIVFNNNGGNIVNAQTGTTVTNNLASDPLFVSASGANFALTAGSPAIDTGITVSGVTTDIVGVTRPQGKAYDIGAYEYPGSSTQQAVSVPPGCTLGSTSWSNVTMTNQAGNFTLQFDATPSMAGMDGIIGCSNGAATDYTSLATIVRFNNTGTIDARNGGSYAAVNKVPYSATSLYHFRLVINVPAHTYSAYVTPPSGTETLLGQNYAFRTEQATVSALTNIGLNSSTGSTMMCNQSAVTAVTLPAGCALAATNVWSNTAFTQQTGQFTLQFDATPSMSKMDAALGASNGAASAYTSLAAAVRFNNVGLIDARSGGTYASIGSIPYSAGLPYHFRLAINVPAHTYSAYVKQGSNPEVAIGTNYAFRAEQATVGALSDLGTFASVGTVTNCSVTATQAPTISGVTSTNVTASAATVDWTTNVPGTSAVDYGTSSSYGTSTPVNSTLATSHSVGLSGLVAGTAYHYRARSSDSSGNQAVSGDYTFTTPAAAPTPTPAPSPSPSCVSVPLNAWKNEPMTTLTGTFTVTFDATPGKTLEDAVMGLSNGAATGYSSLAAAVRFNNTGRIDARNAGSYTASTAIGYSTGKAYHFRLVVNASAHTYSAYVTPSGGTELLIGANYLFRTEQAATSSLNNLAIFDSTGGETLCNLTANGVNYTVK